MKNNHGGPTARLCGWCDEPLSELGEREIQRLRHRLAQEPPPAAVYSSPLVRAKATAEAACCGLGLAPRFVADLREICCGTVDGLPAAEVEARYPELWKRNLEQVDEQFCWPGGETYAAFRDRVLRAVRALAAAHSGQSVLVVTHAGVVSQLLGWLAGLSAARWEAFRPGNASITELIWEGNRGEVLRFDDRSHLVSMAA